MALDFDGVNDKVQYGNATVSDVGQDWALSLWLQYDSGSGYVAGRWLTNVGWFFRSTGTAIQIGVEAGTGADALSLATNFPATWTHYVLNYSNTGSTELFENGVSVGSKNFTSAITEPSTPFCIGNRADDARDWDGRIAEAAFWSGVNLTAAEVNTLAKASSPLMVRPAVLQFYDPLIRTSQELIAANSGTVTGATAYAHPRIIRPSAKIYSFPSGAASGVVSGVGSSAGTSTASGTSTATSAQAGSGAGTSTVAAVGVSTSAQAGSAAGTSTAAAVGANATEHIGSAAGTSTATAVGASTFAASGAASGTSTAAAIGLALVTTEGVGSAGGTSTALAVGIDATPAVVTTVDRGAGSGRYRDVDYLAVERWLRGLFPNPTRPKTARAATQAKKRKQKERPKAIAREWLEETPREDVLALLKSELDSAVRAHEAYQQALSEFRQAEQKAAEEAARQALAWYLIQRDDEEALMWILEAV